MTCSSCVRKIETSIRNLPGIHGAEVALLTHRGKFKYDPSKIGPRDIMNALTVRLITNFALENYSFFSSRSVIQRY